MLELLRENEKDGYIIKEYTKDGKNISHIIKTIIQTEPVEPWEPEPTLEERILAETTYQTALLEMNTLGGM